MIFLKVPKVLKDLKAFNVFLVSKKSRGSTLYKVEPLSFLYGVEPTLRGCFCLRSCNLQLRRTAGMPSNQSATSSY